MSNPPLATLDAEFDSLTEGMGALQVDVIGESSSFTTRTKLSARDLLATLSRRRISVTEIEFIGNGSQDGGAYGDVAVATFVRAGGSREGKRVAVKKLRFVINGDMTEEKFLRIFVNELRVLDKLSHPNIVEIIGFVENVDIWALGWVAWEAITDCYPFEELKGEWDVTMKIIEGRLPLIRGHTQLPQIYPLCSMMQKCWKSEPKERPSATECRKTLDIIPWTIPAVGSGSDSKIRSAALLQTVGEIHRLQGRHGKASKAYNQGLTTARLTGDRRTEGSILVQLALSYRERSKHVEAEASFTEALAIFESIGSDDGRANALLGLGHVQVARSKYVEAGAPYTQALAIYDRTGNDVGRANALVMLGQIRQVRSKYVEAEASYTQALAIYEIIGGDLGRANVSFGLGHVQLAQSKYVEAEASYTQALAIYESFGNDLSRANALLGLGHVQLARAKYVEAEAWYTQALVIYESIGGDLGRANTLFRLGDVQRDQSKYVEAEAWYTQALAVYESIGEELGRANAFFRVGAVQRERSMHAEAAASYTQALAIYESIGHDQGRTNCSFWLSSSAQPSSVCRNKDLN